MAGAPIHGKLGYDRGEAATGEELGEDFELHLQELRARGTSFGYLPEDAQGEVGSQIRKLEEICP